MDNIIKKNYKIPFSEDDIRKVTNGKCKIIAFDEIHTFANMNELLHPYNCVIILYQAEKYWGHWTVVNKTHDDTIEFFNSYGVSPVETLNGTPPEYQPYGNYINYLIKSEGWKCIYNTTNLQSKKRNINTCGRWASIRVLLKHIHLKKFIELFINQKNEPDFYVTSLTMFI